MYRFCAFRRRQAGARFVSSSSSSSLSPTGAFERLEDRRLLSGTTFRSIDGTGNNLANPEWGSVGEQLLREAAAAYADAVSAPAGADRPSAREISNVVAAAVEDGTINDRNLTAFTYVWGQFLDHDLDLTGGGAVREAFNVAVPLGDASFDPLATGAAVIPLSRSEYDPSTGTSADNPRQQTNSITAWIDGSVVYGSDDARAAALRTSVGGRLKTSTGNLLPLNTAGLPNANDAHLVADAELFLAGDVRANENIELTSVQVLFMREHNRVAAQLQARNPRWTDERIYQEARQIISSEIQAITYNEFLPALLGRGALDRYTGYDPTVNPGIANEFSTAAFRLGHSMLGDDVEFLDNNGDDVRDELALANAFFNPGVVKETGIDPILKYLASDKMQEIDNQVVDGVRNFLFGPPGAGGFDLASLNIQRGRDHGLADYNSVRAAYGLPKVTSFDQITSNPELAAKLQELYGSVDDVDLWVGGLAEDHVAGSSMGQTFRTILSDQFERLRDGDRFWYQNLFAAGTRQRDELDRLDLSDVVRRNSGTTNIQDNVFVLDVSVSGSLFNDANGNGRRDFREGALRGWTVQLLDADGNVVGSTLSNDNGRYSFVGLELGTYTVNVVTPDGWRQTTRALRPVSITRGMTVSGLDVGFTRAGGTTA